MRTAAAMILASVLCGGLLTNCIAQRKPSDEAMEYDRRVAAKAKSYMPAEGYIPDAETAISVATAISMPIYGKKVIDSELPLRAELKGGVWTIIGTFHGTGTGGEVIVQLNKRTGAVVFVTHTQ